jgi:hypothetical protein
MTWFKPRTQLDTVEQIPLLQQVENNPNKNYYVKGFAGSGKSLLIIHCLIDEKRRNPNTNAIIVLYTHSLIDMIKDGIPQEFKNTPVVTFYKFRRIHQSFDLILVDEIQDIPENDLIEIESKRSLNGRIIVAGDINQSIYDHSVPSSNIINILNTDQYNLRRIYRLSRRIRKISADFCEDRQSYLAAQVMDFNTNVPVTLVHADNLDQEYKWLWLAAKQYAQAGYVPAILIAKHEVIIAFFNAILRLENKPTLSNEIANPKDKNYDPINSHFRSNNLNIQYLGNKCGSFENAHSRNLVTVMTYHSAKGLDYKTVFIPFLSAGYEIWRDNVSRAKTLFFVALTRSREQLILSYSGTQKHPFLSNSFLNECAIKSASEEINRIQNPFGDMNNDNDIVIV